MRTASDRDVRGPQRNHPHPHPSPSQFQGRVSLVETYPCNVHTSSEFGTTDGRDFILPPGLFGADEVSRYRYTSCCSQTTAATCHSVGPKDQSAATRDQFCIWSESAGCLPLFSSSKKTLDGFVGLGQKDSKTTFLSSKVNVPKSSLIATHRYLDQGFQVVNDRKWLLVVDTPTNEVASTSTPTCMLSATVSYTKSNTGGICEPSTRVCFLLLFVLMFCRPFPVPNLVVPPHHFARPTEDVRRPRDVVLAEDGHDEPCRVVVGREGRRRVPHVQLPQAEGGMCRFSLLFF